MANRCKTCGQPTEYNGWTNYETWAVKLWIDNEEPLYDATRRMTRVVIAKVAKHGPASDVWTVEQSERFELADRLRGWTEDQMPELPASMWSDLLRSAFEDVDWNEIAESLLEDVREEADA